MVPRCCCAVQPLEPARCAGSWRGLDLVICSPVDTFRDLRASRVWPRFNAPPCGAMGQLNLASRRRIWGRLGLLDSGTRGHVELHGLGQRFHRGAGGGESAAQLSTRDDRGHCAHGGNFILPLAAMAFAGISAKSFSTGDWTDAARTLGGASFVGTALGIAVVAGGCITGVGMFNALSMSYTRLPLAMAEDGMLPRVLALRNRRGVPWVSVLFCGCAWALALKLPFERLISIDLILYGSSLLLEFVALVVLRIREPQMHRPFKAGRSIRSQTTPSTRTSRINTPISSTSASNVS